MTDRPGREPVRHILILFGAPKANPNLGSTSQVVDITSLAIHGKISQFGNFWVAPILHYLGCPAELQASCLIQFSKDHPDPGEEGWRGRSVPSFAVPNERWPG